MKDFRQGEVRIKEISEIPKEAKKSKNGEILAVGKSNQHSHRLTGKGFQVFEFENKKYLKIQKQTHLVHEEHKTIKIPKGNYLVQIQKEYLPRAEARKITD